MIRSSRWIRLASSLLVAGALWMPGAAWAGEATDFVKDSQGELFKVIAQPRTEARQDKLRGMFDDVLAYDVLARSSLGDKWGDLSAEEQARFTNLLTSIVRSNYQRNLTMMLDYDVRYVAEEAGDGTVLVKTIAKHKTDKREPDLEVDFRMQKLDAGWRIVDIVTEKASLVKTYRSQFVRILRKQGFDTLIEKMEKKLKKMQAKNG